MKKIRLILAAAIVAAISGLATTSADAWWGWSSGWGGPWGGYGWGGPWGGYPFAVTPVAPAAPAAPESGG